MRIARILTTLALSSLSTIALAQSPAPKAATAPSEAQQSFARLKTLAGVWEGVVTTTPATPDVQGKTAQISLRVTSMGNALLHEAHLDGRPDDPITMFYLDTDQLTLTHYCDAGNRPRMVAKASPDGRTIEFEFVDVVGNLKYGHMHHAVFTFVDSDHHTEDWTWMAPGEKPVQAHFDLRRKDTLASK